VYFVYDFMSVIRISRFSRFLREGTTMCVVKGLFNNTPQRGSRLRRCSGWHGIRHHDVLIFKILDQTLKCLERELRPLCTLCQRFKSIALVFTEKRQVHIFGGKWNKKNKEDGKNRSQLFRTNYTNFAIAEKFRNSMELCKICISWLNIL